MATGKKKIYKHTIKSLEKELLKFKIVSRTGFSGFWFLFTVDEQGPVLMSVIVTPTLKKIVKLALAPTVVKLDFLYLYNRKNFVSPIR